MGNIFSLADVLALVRRRALTILSVVLLGALLTLSMALRLPHVYESYAVLQVELPRVSADAAQAGAVSRSSQRLQLLQQELTGRESMQRLMADHGLFTELPLTASEKVQLLQHSIRIETIRAGQAGYGVDQPVSALVIGVQLGSPLQAAAVANDLAQRVLEMTAQRQSQRVQETLEFYAGQDQRIGAQIAALEAEITAFKNANIDSLPEGLQARHEEIGRLDESLRDLERQSLQLGQELAVLQARGSPRAIELRQMAALETQIGGLAAQTASIGARRAAIEAAIGRAPAVETQLGTFARRAQQLQDQYSVITRQRVEAETSQRLDSERQTERFELLEPAIPPDWALASGRRKMMVFGVFGSLLAGLGLALALELLNPVLRSSRQMERALDLRPVIAIPDLSGRSRRWRGFGRKALAALMLGGAGLAAWVIRIATTVQLRPGTARVPGRRRG